MVLDGQDPGAIARAAEALTQGRLVGLPTETVYGLAANADDASAVAAIFTAKGRPSDHPLIVHLAPPSAPGQRPEALARYAADVPDFAARLIDAFWPGPLTLILPRRPEHAAVAAAGQDSVGLRCPSHPVAMAVLTACLARGVYGVAAPSANQFGRVSPTTAAHVAAEFDFDLLVLDGGPCDVGIESTIVDCSRGAPVLLRPGAVTAAQVEAACGQPLRSPQSLETAAPRASGTLESHYAPRAKVRLMGARELQSALDVLGADARRIAVYARSAIRAPSPSVLLRPMPGDALAAAHELFAALRDFDRQGVALIWVETPPADPAWDGVRDRLQRAAAE
ncbi:threonylcarbamoyl-AMP synthase [Xylophilus rhododendri]|uniref:Threonylcarbamoyl-AMP synthase n=1 Tax=Xylophilus rhododendri TaxID=2697032 RepID=A0A857J804_9BURK|nr:L-threonylcarbamoyladenylate synthase [Xylophilus rhododendri]QHI98915.1 threonylcarbamoyl-AMP synthase [Xylophilus rhododendri]